MGVAPDRVRMLAAMAGPGVDIPFGRVLDVGRDITAEEALRWIAHGVCEPDGAFSASPIETASVEPTGEMAAAVGRRRGRRPVRRKES